MPEATAAATTTATTATTTTAAATTPAAFDWKTSGGLDDAALGYVTNKGWKAPADVLTSYTNLEKLVGAPAERIIKLPENGEFGPEVYDRLGRPKDIKGYGADKWVAPGGDTKFAETAATWFHENGLNPKQAAALAGKWNEYAGAQATAQKTANVARDAQQTSALKAEWGVDFDTNAKTVDTAAAAFGMTPAQIDGLKTAMGPQAAMKFLHNIGAKMGTSDASLITGDTRQTNFTGGMTPEQAKTARANLIKDKEWVKKYSKGDATAKAEMTRLNQIIAPGTTSF